MAHANIPQNEWKEVKSEIQKTWSGIPPEELEKTNGDFNAISGLVQKKYGMRREEADKKLDELIARCGTAAGKSTFGSSSIPGSSVGGSPTGQSGKSSPGINQTGGRSQKP